MSGGYLTLTEYVGNMHMHTPYSDGEGSHEQIAAAALAAGIDFVIVTDHNILVRGVEGYYGDDKRGYVLLLTGEEVHDRQRDPQVNHLLVYGAGMELCQCAADPQELIDAVNAAGGLAYLAHPKDTELAIVHEPPIPWVDWQVSGYAGLELWNYMSDFKRVIKGGVRNLMRAAFRPEDLVIGPNPDTLRLWDDLLMAGKPISVIGNSDAHGMTVRVGILQHVVFPYDFLFSCVNTHILAHKPFSGRWAEDQAIIYRALREGRSFVAYDLIGNARGFRFSATGELGTALMGGTIRVGSGVTLQALCHERSHFKVIHEGKVIAETTGRENITFTAKRPGAYRVEVWHIYKGIERAWIFSNPIYVEP
ncbi:MAG TPA: CehA/McbA family metallohydrolase [Aggregatilineales bacterium]|nr:CehA/McbA family metallohydrolase [Anaerolineales bacterium]HRE49053.1 CehA/McbA family metallohydrolase [Aggregatilineales bacterium]